MTLLALVGCSNNDESADNIPVAEPVVTQITAVCNDHSLKNRLNDTLQATLLDASLARLTGMSELQMQDMETKVRSQLAKISFDLQNVNNTEAGCSADVYITPSAKDLMAAENLLAQRDIEMSSHIKAAGGELIAGRIVAQGVTYKIVDNKAVLDNPEHPLFGATADVLVMAASAIDMTELAQNDTLDAEAVAAAVAAPVVSMRPQVVERSTNEAAAKHVETQPAQAKRPTPTNTQAQAKQKSEQKAQTAPKTEQQKSAAKPAKAETSKATNAETATAVTKSGSETRQTATRSTAAVEKKPEAKQEAKQVAKPETKQVAKPETKTQTKPQAKQEQKSAVPVGEIAVIESNDTY